MSQTQIIKPEQFDASKLSFSDVKIKEFKTKGGQTIKRKVVYPSYNGHRIRIQTPEMALPYGLNENEKIDDATQKVVGMDYSVNLSFKGMDRVDDDNDKTSKKAKKLEMFHQMISALDQAALTEAAKNSLSWIKQKKASPEVAAALYSSILKVSRDRETQEPDGKYPDTIKCKIPCYDGVFKTDVFDEDQKPVDLKESLIKGALAKSIIDVAEVWFVGGKFGMSLRLIQSRVKVPQGLRGYSFLPSDDDDDDVEDGATTVKVEIGSDASEEEVPVSTTQDDIDNVSSSDDESSDDEEEAPPPAKRGKKTKKSS